MSSMQEQGHGRVRSLRPPTVIAAFACLGLAAGTPAHAGEIVPVGSVWKYLDDGSDPGTAWREPGFVDGGWDDGPAQLGYGDGDEQTVVSFGPDSGDKYITTYFRHAFELADPGAIEGATLRVLRDDGAVVYLNGEEVFRTNMPGGAIDYLTVASSTISGSEEDTFVETTLLPGDFVAGTNVLAVEIHQRSGTSSDISFDLEVVEITDGPTVVRGPYLQVGTPASATLRWRTDLVSDSQVAYGPSPTELDTEVSVPGSHTEHEVTLTGLSPGTTYYYSVGTSDTVLEGGDEDHLFTTPPAPGSATPTRIWVIGDSGTANSNAANVRNAYLSFAGGEPTDVWLMLGDNAYSDGTDEEYQAAVFDMYPSILRETFLWPTLGNHDGHSADSPTQSGPYYDIFTLPVAGEAGGLPSGTEAYYSFDHANIHFICLDSHDTDRSPGGAMMTWLEADLADTLADWVIAFWHHPPYSKGSHDSDDEGRLIDMRENALPILEAGGVDLVLSGHSHAYERSFLLDGHYDTSDTLVPEMILDAGDGQEDGDGAYAKDTPGLAPHEGAVYVVAGSSGQVSTDDPLDHPAMFVSLAVLGSMVLDVDGLRLDATFLDDDANVLDTFTIVKGDGTNPADVNQDGVVDVDDLVAVVLAFGPCPGPPDPCPADIDGDGEVEVDDLIAVILNWS